MFQGKVKGLFHFFRISFDIFREGAIGYSVDFVTVFAGKTAGIVQKGLVGGVSDAWKNDGQFRSIFICFRYMCGGFCIEHLQMDFFLKFS